MIWPAPLRIKPDQNTMETVTGMCFPVHKLLEMKPGQNVQAKFQVMSFTLLNQG